MGNKKWNIEDDLYVINEILKKYRSEDWGLLIKRIADEINTSQNSVKMTLL